MKKIEIYDPALCCSSGVCGPTPDEALLAFSSALEVVKEKGVDVSRFNLAQEPLEFANKAEVKAVLEKQGEAGLPLVFVDGEIYFRGVYPTREQLAQVLGVDLENSGCCGGDSDEGCCSEEPEKKAVAFVKVDGPASVGSSCCDSESGCC